MRPTVSILTTGVGPNQASGVGPVPLDKPNLARDGRPGTEFGLNLEGKGDADRACCRLAVRQYADPQPVIDGARLDPELLGDLLDRELAGLER